MNDFIFLISEHSSNFFPHYYQNLLELRASLFLKQETSSFKHSSAFIYFIWLQGKEQKASDFTSHVSLPPDP